MRQVERRRPRLTSLAAAIAVATGSLAAAASPARAETDADLLTDHVVEIHETVSDAGFVHPGVGLSADDLRGAQAQVRSGVEPWASYFAAMADTDFASTTYRASNSVSADEPDRPADDEFDHVGLRYKETNDSFGALTQSLMWVMTGDEVYRENAIQALRTWSNMDPDGYAYFPDAHIHTGKPLSQFLMAAEIIRATGPVDDDTPGEHDGYDVVWSAEDDERLLNNLARPIVATFLYSNEQWMNQHNFGLYGRIATAIYADDPDAYATGVEWLTVNASYDGYDNGAMAPQMPYIEADDPDNPYGYGFVQVREMARDQAHAETNIDNYTALARFLDVQGTTVDPAAGTVSTADDAVSVYEFLDHRLLDGANAFYGFMMGAWTPWVDQRGDDWDGTVSQAYRGRLFNPLSELYYQYTYESGVDVEAEAPWVAELHSRMDGPYYHYGTGTANFWAPGDKSPEYWVSFPEQLAGTEPKPLEDTELTFGRYSLQLDDRTELVTEDGRTFARAHVDERGTTNVLSRMMFSDSAIGLLVRSDGPALLEVLDKEQPSELNELETEPETLAEVEIPDTGGEWRYVTYPSGGFNTHFYRLTGADGTTVDLDAVTLDADAELTAPRFEQTEDRHYLWARAETTLDLSAADDGGSVAHTANGLPDDASLDPATGILTWEPSKRDRGRYDVQIVADDGRTVTARTFELVVAKDQKKMIRAAVADGYDDDAVYTTVSHERFATALDEAEDAARHGSDEDFRAAFAALREAMDGLEPLNPALEDGTLDYTGMVTSTVIDGGAVTALADGDTGSHAGDLRVASFTLDFGTRYRVAPDEFGLQARFSFPMRSQGTNVYGSNDGISWTLLTERMTTETNDMETIPVVEAHRGEAFRYLKLQVDEPGIPIDPAYPGIWSIGEFRIAGERSEVPGTITDVSLSSDDALRERVTTGDSVSLAFSSPTPIDHVAVTVGGETVEATSDDGLSWTAATELGEVNGGGPVPITIDHTTDDGTQAATVLGTTDGSQLYASDERNLIDLASAAQVVDADGNPDPAKADQAAAMFDGDPATHSDIGAADGEYHVIWDFGDGGAIAFDRADFLARQDRDGLTRMDDQVIEGSNDLSTWTTLTEPTAAEHDWQDLDSLDDGSYRYLRVTNGDPIGIAELRVFGTVSVDLDAVLARADAEDLSVHSRASAILFEREVEAVRAASEAPDADRNALAMRLLDAWGLLEDPPVAAAAIDPAWVLASTPSWNGERDAAANGWAMFDGDEATFTDTEQSSGWVRVAPDDDTVFRVETVRFLPRAGYASRADGVEFQGSNDGGRTWATFATVGDGTAEGWSGIALPEAVEYGAVRVLASSGNTNLAEVAFTSRIVDTTGLDLYLSETAALTASDWTAASWAALADARDTGLALRETGAEPTQEEVDAATDALAAAVASLVPAE